MDWLATVTVNMLRQRVHDLPARAFSAQALLSRAATLVLSACCGLMTCSALMAQPQGSWLTIVGDPTDPAVDTIEVDPVPLSVNADTRTMRIRVSRARQRNNWDGVPYRSFNSEVLFECGGNTARYVAMEYFMQPGW
ncbi:MAG: hypothetical protein JWQ72_3175 [Polaromonas sp.]|nr:hypothetical protein [Polaromonas sp.]